MKNLNTQINNYLEYCKNKECLSIKTLGAYQFDLYQYENFITNHQIEELTNLEIIENYIEYLLKTYKTKTVKRKIASIRAFYRYMCYKRILDKNPFHHLQLHFREEQTLPKIIPIHSIENLLSFMYTQKKATETAYQSMIITRDITIIELLFATGIRISELCSLTISNVDLIEHTIKVHGKGNKERIIQIENPDVIKILLEYNEYRKVMDIDIEFFFINRNRNGITDQAVRKMIHKNSQAANITQTITPHMFRHSFATFLLDADVDIRYIQEILGHSSINVTQIYTHVSLSKQKEILSLKHPRNKMNASASNDNK